MAIRSKVASKKDAPGAGEDVLIRWDIDEYPRHDRGMWWNVVAVVAGLGLLVYAFVTGNFLFALIVIMFAILLTIFASRPPRKVSFVITKDGVWIGDQEFIYPDMSRFWIVYDPAETKCLYLDFKSVFKPHLSIPLDDTDPNEVRRALKKYVSEDLDRDSEPLSDYVSRVLKL